jgi:hypothetical protein
MATWWAIAAGLLVEYLLIRHAFGLSWRQALFADLAANLASSVAGFVLIPIAGIVWEFGPGLAMYTLIDVGTFNPVTWMATLAMAGLINAAVEILALGRFGVTRNKRTFWLLALANMATVGVAFGSILIHPVET